MVHQLDILGAVNDWLLSLLPDVEQDMIIRGYQNLMPLPSDNTVIVISIGGRYRVGTNVNEHISEKDIVRTKELVRYEIIMDFISYDEIDEWKWANTVSVVDTTPYPCEFFHRHGIEFLYCDDIRYLPWTDDSKQYIHRNRINMSLSVWESVDIRQQYFDTVTVKPKPQNPDEQQPPDKPKQYFELVDAEHKP